MVRRTVVPETGAEPAQAGGVAPAAPGRHRSVPEARCRNPLHHNSKVTSNGTFWRGGRHYRAYRCEPAAGLPHVFSVVIGDDHPQPAWSAPPEGAIRAFFWTTGQHAGSGVCAAWRKHGRTPLADATLRLVRQHWIEAGQHARAQQLAQLAWAGGCRDPEIAEAHAIAIARAGREPDLRAALDVCTEALTLRAGNTDDAWRSLAIRQAQIAGRIERGRVCYTGEVDAAGNPIIARRHQPRAARRVRQPRFLRV